MSNIWYEICLRIENLGGKYVIENMLSTLLLLLLQRDTFLSVNTAYQSECSFRLTYLGRPVELDPPQVRPWPVQFTFCDVFLPLDSSSNNCFSHVYISCKPHENVPVIPAMNFPRNSIESRDFRHSE